MKFPACLSTVLLVVAGLFLSPVTAVAQAWDSGTDLLVGPRYGGPDYLQGGEPFSLSVRRSAGPSGTVQMAIAPQSLSSSGTVVGMAANVVVDGVSSPSDATDIWNVDPPTVVISGVPSIISSTDQFTATFTFSEEVTGFDVSDVTVTGGTKGTSVSGSGAVYMLAVTPSGSEDVMVTVAENAASDGTDMGPTSAVSKTALWVLALDIDVPFKIDSTDPFTATFTFSEEVTGFDVSDVTVTGGTKGTSVSGSGAVYMLAVTPDGDVDVMVTVRVGAAFSKANSIISGPIRAISETAIWDDMRPTVAITVPDIIISTDPFTVTFTFSEVVTGFDNNDVRVTGGKKTKPLSGSGAVYTLEVTPDGDEDVTVTVRKGAASDGLRNGPLEAVTETAVWDVTPPTVEITDVPRWINTMDPFTVTFTFSEDVTGFAASDVDVTGGTKGASVSGSGASYTLVVTPDGDEDVVVTVMEDAATDLAGNAGPAADAEATATWDDTPPSVEINLPRINSQAPFTATFTFSEAVNGFTASDVTVVRGTKGASVSGSGAVYTLEVTPTGEGISVAVAVLPSAVTDLAGNTGPPNLFESTAIWDDTPPTVAISVPDRINSTDAFTATFTFSEGVTGFAADDVAVDGGTKGASVSGSGASYTLVVTPEGDVDVVVTVMEDAATDRAGNAGPAADAEATATWDSAPPTVVITVPVKINTMDPFTATFKFSEAVTGFTASDVTVEGGTKGASVSGSGAVYTLELTPVAMASVQVTVKENVVTDLAGNAGPPKVAQVTAIWDITPPTVNISGLPPNINSKDKLQVVFTFSENVFGFGRSDVTVSGGTGGGITGSGSRFAMEVTPTGSADVVVTVAADAVTDLAGNVGPTSPVSAMTTWDSTRPDVAITVPVKINSTDPFTATFTFTEDVRGFEPTDVTVSGGTKGATISGSGAVYTMEVTPTGSADVVVTVKSGGVVDVILQSGPPVNRSATAIWDVTPPTVSITGLPLDRINSLDKLTAILTFSEDVTGFITGDVTVSGGMKGTFTANSATEYTLDVTPTGGADVVITVIEDAAIDLAGNTGPTPAATATVLWDASGPTVDISVPKINGLRPHTATFTFSEDVTGFTIDDITVENGTKGRFTPVNGSTYTLRFTPTGSRNPVVTVAAHSATDGLQTGPPSEVTATAVWDVTPPTVRITVPDKINSMDKFTAMFTFSEDVTGFVTDDVTVTGGVKGTFTSNSGTEYTLEVTPTGSANVVVTVAANSVTDGANTGPRSVTMATSRWDVDAPTLEITVPKINSMTPFMAMFTFSEAVTGFAASDVTVTGGTKGTSVSGSGAEYMLAVTPTGSADVVVSVAANSVTDATNNMGPPSVVMGTAIWDAIAPTVTISGVPPRINSTGVFTSTFMFSEDVTGFVTDDVTVSGGMKGTFTAKSGTEYTLAVTPTGSADVVVTAVAHSASDGVNLGPPLAVTATAVWDATIPAVAIDLPARINSKDPFTAMFTFSKDVTGFITDDVTVSGATKGAFVAGSATEYTLEVTPTGSADVVVTVVANAATDGTGNTGPLSVVMGTAIWDATAPTVAIDVPPRINSTDAFTATFTFSEEITGFVTDDVTVSGGMKGSFTANSGTEYTLAVTPTGSADVVVTVAADVATDGVNLGPSLAVTATTVWDITAPTVAISGIPPRISSTDAFTATFTFSEDVTGFVTDDISVAGGTKGTFTANSRTEYTLLVTPTGSADVVVTVVAAAATDGANTGPSSAVAATAVWDTSIPSVAIDLPARINSTDAFTTTFTFSQAVSGFEAGDIAVTGGTKGTSVSGSGAVYTLMVTPTGSVDVVVTVEANAATDGVNTGPSSAVTATVVWDAIPPALSIDLPPRINSTDAFTARFTFSEDVTGFDIGDVTVTGGTGEFFTADSEAEYTLEVTPTGSVDVVVTVVADAATDGVNPGPSSVVIATAVWDSTAPTVAVDLPSQINSTDAFTVTFTFSEDVTGFGIGAVTVTGGIERNFTIHSGARYTLEVEPTGLADVVVTVAAHSATDGLHTGPSSAVTATAVWDATIPSVAVDLPSHINSTDAFTVTFTFSEDVTGFVTGDITVAGGTKGAFTASSGMEYALEVTPTGDVDVVVTVAAHSAIDATNNTGPLSVVMATAIWDVTAPAVAIDVPPRINSTDAFTAMFRFSEDVTGFVTGDVTVTGGTKGNFIARSAVEYALEVTPAGSADVVVTVAAHSATDPINNTGPLAAASATSIWDVTAPTVAIDLPSKINSTAMFTAMFTFSEDVTGFEAEDITVTGGRMESFTASSGTEYTLEVTPTGAVNVVVTVAANAATDGVNLGPPSAVIATAIWEDIIGIATEEEEPSFSIALQGNYPNPVSDYTNIVFDLPEPSQITVRVTDLLGRTMQMASWGWFQANRGHAIKIDVSNLTSGTYHYTLMVDTGNHVVQRSKTMVIVR